MLLTITYTGRNTTDLGYLLYKNQWAFNGHRRDQCAKRSPCGGFAPGKRTKLPRGGDCTGAAGKAVPGAQ